MACASKSAPSGSMQSRRWQVRRSAITRMAAIAIGAVVAIELACVQTPRSRGPALAFAEGSGDGAASQPISAYVATLADAMLRIDSLSAEVDRIGVVSDFGRRAGNIVKRALSASSVTSGSRDARALETVLDGRLQALFRQQLQTLRDRSIDRYEELMTQKPNPFQAGLVAQREFADAATALVRPGSDWSYEAESDDLLSVLKGSHARDSALVSSRAEKGQGKHVTIQVLKKLQEQSESIQRESEARGALPWNFRWQWFLERSPLGFRGQYAQGRSIVEMLLMPHPSFKDQGLMGILNRVGPLNVAVGFDLFM
eukprot:TRINITY_DN22516_c0_g1_i1.p1 TRINITY_DN22516_c0_g1~~TRINITY_DN22516_c0_g1_i1.p1  ORF type:complete len:313 (+),score=61.27 TRINITY_DN22516_c0_g1_i1:101-1039(+)